MVVGAAFSGDGRFLLTGAQRKLLGPAEGLLALRDARAGRLLADLAGHVRSLPAIFCSPDGRLAISADTDGEIFGWRLPSGS
jgi:WD40 repeat protein